MHSLGLLLALTRFPCAHTNKHIHTHVLLLPATSASAHMSAAIRHLCASRRARCQWKISHTPRPIVVVASSLCGSAGSWRVGVGIRKATDQTMKCAFATRTHHTQTHHGAVCSKQHNKKSNKSRGKKCTPHQFYSAATIATTKLQLFRIRCTVQANGCFCCC